ncbi:MAG: hypothetical protein DWQ08_06930 [Proteobacteria bacterium]|nr:MAG: hypothetical protein DWQ08_06930 [Pseudomonadota bacterium]
MTARVPRLSKRIAWWGRVAAVLAVSAIVLYTPVDDVFLSQDPIGYGSQALSIAEGRGNAILVTRDVYVPGIYPVGTPFLLSIPIRFLGPDMRTGIFSIHVAAVLCALFVFLIAARVRSTVAGFSSVVVLLSSPIFLDASSMLMSQVPTATMVLASMWLFLRAQTASGLFLASFLASATVLVRLAAAVWPIALFAACLIRFPPSTRANRRVLLACAGANLAGVVLLLLHNHHYYGDLLRTGYDYWGWNVPTSFSFEHLRDSWRLVTQLSGFDSLYSVPVFAMAVLGIHALTKNHDTVPARSCLLLTVLAVAGNFLLLSGFVLKSVLYWVPFIPLVAVAAGVGVDYLWRIAPKGVCLALLFVIGALGALTPAPVTASFPRAVDQIRYLIELDGIIEADAVLITTAYAPLTERVPGPSKDRVFLPLARPEMYALRQSGFFRQDRDSVSVPRLIERIQGYLAAQRPVYLDKHPPYGAMIDGQLKSLLSQLELENTDTEYLYRVVRVDEAS